MDISVVIPIYNEQGNIKILHEKLSEELKKLKKSHEIIFVDDGSKDGSQKILEDIAKKDKKAIVIKFRRNFGQTAAMSAGFDNAKGRIIITMDGDLQNDPRDIPRLLEKMDEGFDVVSGWRHKRRDPLSKKIPSKMASWLRQMITKDTIHDSGCSLKAYKKECFDDLVLYGEMHRFIPTLLKWKGFRIGEVKVNHFPRKHGKTKYGTGRILKGFLDLINAKFWMSFSTKPMHFFGGIGFMLMFLGSLMSALDLLYHRFISLKGIGAAGPILLLSAVLIMAGIQFLLFGFLAEMQARSYYENKESKKDKIEKRIN